MAETLPGNIATTPRGLIFFVTDKPRILQRDPKFGSRILSLEYTTPKIEATVNRFKGSGLLLLTGQSLGKIFHPAVGFGLAADVEHFRVSGVKLGDGRPADLLAFGLTGSFSSVAGFPDFSTSPTRPGKFFIRRPAVRGVSVEGFFEATETEIRASGVRTGRPTAQPKLRQPPPTLPAKAQAPIVKDGVGGPNVAPAVLLPPTPRKVVQVVPPVSQRPVGLAQVEEVDTGMVALAGAPTTPAVPQAAVLAFVATLFFFLR